ncbi:MAG: lipopolysaccharide transport periplasmic protein LptA [Steroidobacteraceae bacterium]
MAASYHRSARLAALLPAAALLLFATAAVRGAAAASEVAAAPAAAPGGTRTQRGAAVQVDAASSSVDYRSNTVLFRDVTISQGTVRVAAEQARATGLDFDNATWNFRGNVRISVDGGGLRSTEATVYFVANRVSRATITGTPAEFEQLRAASGELARGRASAIEYDLVSGTVRLRGDAWLTDGRNEISGEELVYDVRGQRVQADTRPGAQQRVRITIRPRDAQDAAAPPKP